MEPTDYCIDFKFIRFPASFQLGTTVHHARENIRLSGFYDDVVSH